MVDRNPDKARNVGQEPGSRGRSAFAVALERWFDSQTRFATHRAMAEAAGISPSSIRDYLSGRRFPSPEARRRLFNLTELPSLDDPPPLFEDRDSSPTTQLGVSVTEGPGDRADLPATSPPSSEANPPMNDDKRAQGQQYSAYMATALTNLERAARMGVIFISDCVANVCKEHGIDLYEPRKVTDPVHNAQIADHRVYLLDREKVTMSDLVIVLCEYPSFGAGQEIEIAGNATVPLILLVMGDKQPSRMVTGTPVYKLIVTFMDPDDLTQGLHQALTKLQPHLEERRQKMLSTPIPQDLGARIKQLRKEARLDQEELAAEISVSEQFIKNLEETGSTITNLSLIQLAGLARVLKVPMYEILGESDPEGNAMPRAQISWARRRGVRPERLRQVLNFAARTPPEEASGQEELSSADLEAMLQRLEHYEKEHGN